MRHAKGSKIAITHTSAAPPRLCSTELFLFHFVLIELCVHECRVFCERPGLVLLVNCADGLNLNVLRFKPAIRDLSTHHHCQTKLSRTVNQRLREPNQPSTRQHQCKRKSTSKGKRKEEERGGGGDPKPNSRLAM